MAKFLEVKATYRCLINNLSMITFVTFHVNSRKETANHIASLRDSTFSNDYDYLLMIDLLFRSISIFHPVCKKVVLTDLTTDLSDLDKDIHIHRLQIDPESIMLSRLTAQLEYIKNHDFDSDIVLIDSDMLVNKSLESLFQQDFSIALTYRHLEDLTDMPINGGIIFLSKARKQDAIKFLDRVYSIYQKKYLADYKSWWGDQFALFDALGHQTFFQRSSDIVEIDNIKILLLDCELYNFSPEPHIYSIAFEYKNKIILHFKGRRKNLISMYWQSYLAIKEKVILATVCQAIWIRSILLYHLLRAWSQSKKESFINKLRSAKSKLNTTFSELTRN